LWAAAIGLVWVWWAAGHRLRLRNAVALTMATASVVAVFRWITATESWPLMVGGAVVAGLTRAIWNHVLVLQYTAFAPGSEDRA